MEPAPASPCRVGAVAIHQPASPRTPSLTHSFMRAPPYSFKSSGSAGVGTPELEGTHTQSLGSFAVFTQCMWEIAAGERSWFNNLLLRHVSTLYFLRSGSNSSSKVQFHTAPASRSLPRPPEAQVGGSLYSACYQR